MYGIIVLRVSDTTICSDNLVINQTNSTELNSKLNALKYEAICAWRLLFTRFTKNKSDNKEKLEPIFKSAAKIILTSLHSFYNQNQQIVAGNDYVFSLTSLLQACMKYLIISSTYSEHYDIYAGNYHILIRHVLLPRLIADRDEQDSIVDNPAEFVNFNDQLIRYPNGNNLKCVSASLLCSICAHIDGAMRFTVFGVMATIDKPMSLGMSLPHVETWTNDSDEAGKTQAAVISKVESGLLVLSVLNRVADRQKHILAVVEQFIEKFVPYLGVLGDMLTVRFMFFVTSYIDKIYAKQQGANKRKDILEWLLTRV